MSLSRKIAQNTAVQVVGKLVGTALSLVAAGLIFRYLGDAGFGRYTTIVAFLQIFGIVMDFGLYIIMIKKLSEITDRSREVADNIFTLRIVSGVIVLGLAPITAWILGRFEPSYSPEIITGIALTTFFFLFISLNQLLSAVFQKFLKTNWVAVAELIGKAVLVAASALVIWLDAGLLWVMATLVVSSGANFLVNFLASRKYLKLRLRLSWPVTREVLREAWPIALSIFFGVMYFKGNAVILTFYETDEVVGWYGAPYKILEVLITFPAMFAGLVLPVITVAWHKRDGIRFQRMLQKSFDALVMIALPMVAGTMVLAPAMMRFIAGTEFDPSIPILKILMLSTATIYVGTLFTYLVVAIDKQRTMIFGYAFAAVTSLAGYFIFIPKYSMVGAAWVAVYAEVAILLIAMAIVLRTSTVRLNLTRVLKAAAAAVAMYLMLRFSLPSVQALGADLPITWGAVITLVLLIPGGMAVYGLALVVLRALTPTELRDLIQLRNPRA
jgi:O-antigen/teichoic acid export membrane protein